MNREDFAAALKNAKLEGFVWPEPDEAGDLRIITNVVQCGCHIIAVEKEINHPEFVYSIGLYWRISILISAAIVFDPAE